MEIELKNNQFILHKNQQPICQLEFEIYQSCLDVLHIEIVPTERGNKYGDLLCQKALDYSQQHTLTLKATCTFMQHGLNKL